MRHNLFESTYRALTLKLKDFPKVVIGPLEDERSQMELLLEGIKPKVSPTEKAVVDLLDGLKSRDRLVRMKATVKISEDDEIVKEHAYELLLIYNNGFRQGREEEVSLAVQDVFLLNGAVAKENLELIKIAVKDSRIKEAATHILAEMAAYNVIHAKIDWSRPKK